MKTTTRAPILLLLAAGLLAGCAGAVPPTPDGVSPTPTAESGAPDRPPGAPEPPIDTVEEAIAAVGAVDSSFLGYEPFDPDVIGASAWVEVEETADGYLLTFMKGSGDCPAGCINRAYAKFAVDRDGSVELLCEWREGGDAAGTPC